MTFTVEVKNSAQLKDCEIEIYLDDEGLRDLLKQLGFLKNKGDDLHFFTEEWGDGSLTNKKFGASNALGNHLKITLV